MKKDQIISKFFGFSIPTYYNWKKEKRPIIQFIEKYLSTEEIVEFLEYKTISKQDFSLLANNEYENEYESFTENYSSPFIFPTKLYYDFLQRFKSDIKDIHPSTAKEDFMVCLYEYQLILIDIAHIIKYPKVKLVKDLNYFFELLNKKDNLFFIYIIFLLKNDKLVIYDRHAKNSLFGDDNLNSDKIIEYKSKDLLYIGIDAIKKINKHLFYEEKVYFTDEHERIVYISEQGLDFFEVYQDFLINNPL